VHWRGAGVVTKGPVGQWAMSGRAEVAGRWSLVAGRCALQTEHVKGVARAQAGGESGGPA
jgi:hypothetical protein